MVYMIKFLKLQIFLFQLVPFPLRPSKLTSIKSLKKNAEQNISEKDSKSSRHLFNVLSVVWALHLIFLEKNKVASPWKRPFQSQNEAWLPPPYAGKREDYVAFVSAKCTTSEKWYQCLRAKTNQD